MTASEQTGNGPVIHDNRRIDPVTGQVRRGRHAASRPAGTPGAGRQGAGAGPSEPGPGEPAGGEPAAAAARSGSRPAGGQPAGGKPAGGEDEVQAAEPAEEVLEGTVEETPADKAGEQRADAEARLAERTADLQRLQAEYANYRKRVDRDRAAVREQAVATALAGLLPVLDAIDQAREHGELSGGFKSVADQLQSALAKLGLVAYG